MESVESQIPLLQLLLTSDNISPGRKETHMDSTNQLLALHIFILLKQISHEIKNNTSVTIKDCGLSITQYELLSTVFVLGPMTIKDLLLKMGETSGNMTVVVRNLERDGYIIKKSKEEDKRCFLIQLSKKGMDLMTEKYSSYNEKILSYFSSLTEEEKQSMIVLLKKLKKGKEV